MDHASLDHLCKSLKGTTLDIKWGDDLCYCVGEKMYAVTSLEGPFRMSMKVSPEEFGELTTREGIIPAPYMARYNWVYVEEPEALKAKEWEYLVRQSYNLVFDKLKKQTQREILSVN